MTVAPTLATPAQGASGRYDVAVVGLGPVGAIAALLLAREGLTVIAIEPSPTPYDKPRAMGIDHESLRVLQALGITDELLPHMGEYRPSEYIAADGRVLRRILPAAAPYPLAWPPYNTFVQPELERLLRERLAASERIEVRYGDKFRTFEQADGHLSIMLEGEHEPITASYLIGCDGAWSPVREAAGLTLEDLEFDEPWLVVDLLLRGDDRLPATTTQFCDPARPATLVHGPGAIRRFEIMLLPDEDPSEMVREERVWSLLERWLTPADAEIWRAATYRFHALVARQWRQGRVFIAGDAAHQTPPFMAQGLNQGIRDVANLAWKIAHVVSGKADESLLDTYDEERRPNARAVIEITKTLGRLICERDPAAATLRNEMMLAEMAAGTGEIIRQDLLPPIRGGLTRGGEDGSPTNGAGMMFPQPWITREDGERMRLDDLLPSGFLLVTRHTPSAGVRAELDVAGITLLTLDGGTGAIDLATGDRDGLIDAWMTKLGLASVLVRPDHVVFAGSVKSDGEATLASQLNDALHMSELALS